MRENEPDLLVLSVCDGEIILEKGEILSEKRHPRMQKLTSKTQLDAPHLGQAVPPVLCPRELLLSRSIMRHLLSRHGKGKFLIKNFPGQRWNIIFLQHYNPERL
jgi:hypothetical protein